jgi:hypothetical protein
MRTDLASGLVERFLLREVVRWPKAAQEFHAIGRLIPSTCGDRTLSLWALVERVVARSGGSPVTCPPTSGVESVYSLMLHLRQERQTEVRNS